MTEELNREFALREHDRQNKARDDALQSAKESANLALRTLVLVNGGAVVALLAFVAGLEANVEGFNTSILVTPIWWFAVGVGCSATSASFAYLTNMSDADICSSKLHTWQHPYTQDTPETGTFRRLRQWYFAIALLLAICSLFSFFFGIFTITGAINSMSL